MSPRLPRLTAKEVRHKLEVHGFEVVRQHGSHMILRDPEGRRVTLPSHAGKILHPKILELILDDAGLSEADFGPQTGASAAAR
jgi:predicted RNA binding protein YcfA (HicA-like mRNA interferase family)